MFHGGASALLSRGFALLVNAISLPLTVRYLGAEQYGIWVTVSTSVVLIAMLDLGIASSLTNMISRAYAENDKTSAQRFYASAFWSSCGVSAALGLFCWAAWGRIDWNSLFHLHDPRMAGQAEACVAIAVVFFLLSLPLNLVNRVLSGYQQTQVTNYANLLNGVLGLIAILLVVFTRGSLVELMLVYSVMMLAGTVALNIWVVFREKRWLIPSLSAMSREAIRELLGSGFGFFVLQLAGLIVFNSDNFVIAHYLGPSDVTPYSVTWRMASYASALQSALLPALWPAYSEAYARGDSEWVRQMFWKAARWSMAAATVAVLILVALGRPIIRWYAGAAAVPSQILLIAICAWTVIGAGMELEACLLAAVNRVKLQGVLSVIAAVVNIWVSIHFVTRIGSLGVVLGTIVSYALVLIGPQTMMAWKVLYPPDRRLARWPESLGVPLLWILSTTRLPFAMRIAESIGLIAERRGHEAIDSNRFLVVNLSGFLGDQVMTLPMIEELRSAYPDATIACAVPRGMGTLMGAVSLFDQVYSLELPSGFPIGFWQSLGRSYAITREFWRKMREEIFDVCILPRWKDDGFRATVLAYLAQAKRRIGFPKGTGFERIPLRESLFTNGYNEGSGLHDPVRFVLLLELAGLIGKRDLDALSAKESLALLQVADGVDWDALRSRLGLAGDARFAVIAPGAGGEKRRWPVERWAAVARAIQSEGFTIVTLAGKQDSYLADELYANIGDPKVAAAGVTTLPETAALLRHAELFLGSDSGPAHMAGALGVSSVVLFIAEQNSNPDGVHAPERVRPLGSHVVCLRPEKLMDACKEACSASEPHCILNIRSETVIQAARSLIHRQAEEGKKLVI